MNNRANSLPHTAAGGRIESAVRRVFAAACIATLVGFGVYYAWQVRSDWDEVLLALAVTLGPATAYAFGYFYYLPDVLGASAARRQGTLPQRWSEFARLSVVIAVLVSWTAWIRVIAKGNSGGETEAIRILHTALVISLVLAMSWVMIACVVASEEYLARTMGQCSATASVSWRAAARRFVGKIGAGLVKRFRAKRSIVLGSAMTLSSLVLMTTVDYGCDDVSYRGYKIVTGNASWITGQSAEGMAKAIVEQAGRYTYVVGLAIAVAALMWVLVGPRHHALRTTRLLAGLAAGLAIFGVCDYTFAWVRFGLPEPLASVVGIAVWLLPVALWLKRTRRFDTSAQYTKLAVMVFYLPVLFFCLAMLVFVGRDAIGYVLYLLGMLLVWWGLVQSQWEVVGPP